MYIITLAGFCNFMLIKGQGPETSFFFNKVKSFYLGVFIYSYLMMPMEILSIGLFILSIKKLFSSVSFSIKILGKSLT